jgi:GAF domain-containing protein
MRYAVGAHASDLRGLRRSPGTGIVGWCAVNLKPAVNADPALDLGIGPSEPNASLRACLALPLVERDCLIGVLALYRTKRDAFSEDELRLLELLAPRLAAALDTALEAEDVIAQPARLPSQSLKLVKRESRDKDGREETKERLVR